MPKLPLPQWHSLLIALLLGHFCSSMQAQTIDPIRAEMIRNHFARNFSTGQQSIQQPPQMAFGDEPFDGFFNTIRFRTFDGTMNNLVKTSWGATFNNLVRRVRADYSDGVAEPAGFDRRSPREISNKVSVQLHSINNNRGMTSMVWQWGQFLDHDIDLTVSADPAEEFPVPIPLDDPFFDPFGTGSETMEFFRSRFNPNTGQSPLTPVRQQTNSITAWIDGSQVYGSSEETCNSLRLFEGGMMKTSEGGLLPKDAEGFYMAGDIRANEQVALTCLHTLFVREHNLRAADIALRKPHLNDEQIFLRARRHVIALLQAISYNEFLPALLGPGALSPYQGYDPNASPKIRNVFSTAAYRFGHSMLAPDLMRLENDRSSIPAGPLELRDAFFNPDHLANDGMDCYIKGLTVQRGQEIDCKMVDDVRNFLFGPPGAGGFDLASLNIQRGRDHGLADYNSVRRAYGLPPADFFDAITSNQNLQLALFESYDGDVDNIDPWVGMLAEDHVPGASVGPTVLAILKDQFERLRNGDRFWYQRNFDDNGVRYYEKQTLRKVIRRNTDVRQMQLNVFFTAGSQPE